MNARAEFDFPEDAPVAQLRIPPHSIEAESSVLGALLLDGGGGTWDRVADLLTDSDFYRLEHRLTFAAIAALVNASKPADVITVHAQLQGMKNGAEVGLTYLGQLAQYVPSVGNIRRYAEIVRERSILRKLVAVSDEIATKAFSPAGADAAAVLDEAQRLVLGVAEQGAVAGDGWRTSEDGIVALLDRIQTAHDGDDEDDITPTGLADVDELLNGGLRAGQLVIIGARPSMGKTALAVTITEHICESGMAAGMFSMEMTERELQERRLSMASHIHLTRVQRPKYLKDFDWPALTKGIDALRLRAFEVCEQGGLNINQVRSKARALKRRFGSRLKAMTVDYLGLMAGTDPKMSRVYQIEEITKGLKGLAKELGVSIVLLCQLNRGLESRPDQRPMLSDLRDSGSIEQDADIVMFVHREYKAKPGLGDEWKYHAEIIVAKNRNGRLGTAHTQYIGENTRFMDWPVDRELPTSMARTKATGKQL